MTAIYTHATLPCAELDRRAHLPPEQQFGATLDPLDRCRIQARRAQIHLEMRMEMARAEEEAAAVRQS